MGAMSSMRRMAAVLAAVLLPAVLAAAPAAAATGPVTWNGATWCPSYHTWNGCNTVQNPAQFTSSFAPAQVTADATGFTLTMNAAGTVSGAVNTQTHTTWPIGSSW